ncbi:Calcium-binding and coiled-coil domain-containing protein 2 [Merluccius polli]|uniref:Calcium-binding and coiled-coil domain-containing protein 2 n=1 Tax=Merluccius polli TaxID=89951 RepID=A0AA47MC63_MERPO|nr:Calcium-binding and coiled-coil domain-containing protein 2 [Merluccius polli]
MGHRVQEMVFGSMAARSLSGLSTTYLDLDLDLDLDLVEPVVFNDIPKTYIRSSAVTCRYTLAAGFRPSARDWVGVFKVGWSTTRDYYNFVWVDPPLEPAQQEEPTRKQSLFRGGFHPSSSSSLWSEYYLPKEESEFYQFCYVDHAGHVRGASTPFSFQPPVESMDCSLDEDLVVVTTQNEVDQSTREKEELREALEQLRMGSHSVQRALQEKEREVDCLKEQNQERDKRERELVEELNQARKQNESMAHSLKEKGQEAERLMEEILIQTKNHLEHDQHNASEKGKPKINTAIMLDPFSRPMVSRSPSGSHQFSHSVCLLHVSHHHSEAELQEKYDQAVIQINQLKVDLKFSENDKEKLSAELTQLKRLTLDMERLKSENQELRKSLAQQESRHNRLDQDNKAQCNTIIGQLENTRTQLANERKESKDSRKRAEEAERVLLDTKEQLHTAAMENDRITQKSIQLKLRLAESQDIIAEKEADIAEINGIVELRENRLKIQNQEKEQLVRENQRLRINVEELRRELMDLRAAESAACSQAEWQADCPPPRNTLSPAHGQEQNTLPEFFQFEEPHNITGRGPNTQERRMVCRNCHMCFPGITQEELEQHEQSHRVCPFCTLICDDMEQSEFEDHVYSHGL